MRTLLEFSVHPCWGLTTSLCYHVLKSGAVEDEVAAKADDPRVFARKGLSSTFIYSCRMNKMKITLFRRSEGWRCEEIRPGESARSRRDIIFSIFLMQLASLIIAKKSSCTVETTVKFANKHPHSGLVEIIFLTTKFSTKPAKTKPNRTKSFTFACMFINSEFEANRTGADVTCRSV